MNLEAAILMATQAHSGQTDKQGAPYILHPLRVMLAVPPELRIAAVLHDVVEDTSVTLGAIRAEFGDEVADTVDALSRRDGETYIKDFIARVARHPAARIIKRADIADNLGRLTPDLAGMERRYSRALAILADPITCSLAEAPERQEPREGGEK